MSPTALRSSSRCQSPAWDQILAYIHHTPVRVRGGEEIRPLHFSGAKVVFCEISQDQFPGTAAFEGDFRFKSVTFSDPPLPGPRGAAEPLGMSGLRRRHIIFVIF